MFETHKLSEAGLDKAARLRRAFGAIVVFCESIGGVEGREMALVRTKLEEAHFFATRAMVARRENVAEVVGE